MKQDDKKQTAVFAMLGAIPVIWLALLIAPAVHGGLPLIVTSLPQAFKSPLSIQWHKDSLKTVLIFLCAYGLGIGIYFATRRNYRRGEEHGSAQWDNAKAINKKYADRDFFKNKILTQNVSMGLDGRKHRRNLNTIVIGGSGAGKSRFYARPAILSCNTSFVILDCKGELLRDTGDLISRTHKLKVLNLIDMEKSDHYNPFVYLKTENDVQRLVTNLFKATDIKGAQPSDPFWDNSAKVLLSALVFYLWLECIPQEQNFSTVMELLRAGEVKEDDEDYKSALDILFDRLEARDSNHIALKYYRNYRSGSGKTLKSIQITLAVRLEKFNLQSLADLTENDELEIEKMGEEKTALYMIIPDNDDSFNFIVSILYLQLFQVLFAAADQQRKGSLPIPIHFVMDEFANVSVPNDFDRILSVMRSRNIFVSIILQNIAQLKNLFEKQWESILGNCDTLLYLGGNETSTHKLISESYLGKETIFADSYSKSIGRSGSYSTSNQLAGRELMTSDEVRMLDNRYSLLFIRGEKPIMDLKYDLMKHPNIQYTPDGGGKAYEHKKARIINLDTFDLEFLTEEEFMNESR